MRFDLHRSREPYFSSQQVHFTFICTYKNRDGIVSKKSKWDFSLKLILNSNFMDIFSANRSGASIEVVPVGDFHFNLWRKNLFNVIVGGDKTVKYQITCFHERTTTTMLELRSLLHLTNRCYIVTEQLTVAR